MNSKSSILVFLLVGLGNCFLYYSQKDSPVIGVYTQPSRHEGHDSNDTEYILGSYQNWLAQYGARVVPVPFSATKEELKSIFMKINGLLFTGGGLDLDINAQTPHTNVQRNLFVENAKYLMDLAKESNRNQSYFPVYGICQGFELMILVEHQNLEHNILTNVQNDEDFSRALLDYDEGAKLFSYVDAEVFDYVSKHDSLFYYHEWAVTEDSFNRSDASKIYQIKGYSANNTIGNYKKGDYKYISAVEGIEFPFYAIQFHPEYQQFEFFFNFDKSEPAILFSQELSHFFIEEAKKSNHSYSNNTELSLSLITNVNPILKSGDEYWQVYYFSRQYYPLAKYEHSDSSQPSSSVPGWTWVFVALTVIFLVAAAFFGFKMYSKNKREDQLESLNLYEDKSVSNQ